MWSYWGGSGGQEEPTEQPTYFDEDGWVACRDCGSYLEETANSTDTGSDWEDAAHTQELQAYMGSFDGCNAQSIKEEYLRWSQSHRERGLQRSQSETGREWGRRTPGRGSAGGSAGGRAGSASGSRGSTLADFILETPPARNRTS